MSERLQVIVQSAFDFESPERNEVELHMDDVGLRDVFAPATRDSRHTARA